jgi:general secretion pathway protein E
VTSEQIIEPDQDFEQAITELLIARGKLTANALARAERVRETNGGRLDQLLPKLGLISERDLAEAIAEKADLPLVGAPDMPDKPLLEDKLSARFLREARILPLAERGDTLVLAMADPLDSYALEAIRLIAGCRIEPCIAIPADLERAIDRLYGQDRSLAGREGEAGGEDGDLELDVERLKDLASEAPVIRLVNRMIAKAVESRASDIHIEPFENGLRMRYRIDGVLREMDPPPAGLRAAVTSRIKIMAKLNIAERRLPQDGRIKLAIRGTPIDLRISTIPTLYGESVVMRVLDRTSVSLEFERLGIAGASLARYLEVLERPHGIFLVTGPTGSGKTTTLYASLVQLNSPEKKIITVEDPIEYELEGVNQIQVKPNIGLNFANVLRAILRQDPDTVLVGEIRDLETAQIAVQAALTGHLVLSTLHTNNAASSITRLLDMGLEDYLLTSTLNGVTAQRLVRTLCPDCRESYPALPELIAQLGLAERQRADGPITLYRAVGCEACNNTGYRGRSSILEVLPVTDSIRQLVLRRAEALEIHRVAVSEGMQTMYESGMDKALVGQTSVEEVLRVTRAN